MTPPATPETWAGTSISDRVWLGETMKPWAIPNSDSVAMSHQTDQSHSWTPTTTRIDDASAVRVTVIPQATMARPARSTYRPAICDEMEVKMAEGGPSSAAVEAETPRAFCRKIAARSHTGRESVGSDGPVPQLDPSDDENRRCERG